MMKTSRLLLVATFILFAISCKKDEAGMKTDTNAGLTQDQAVQLAVSSMAGSTFGFASVANSEASSAIAMNNISTDGGKTINAIDPNTLYQKCGTTVADSLASAGTANSITYSSLYKFARTLNCTTGNVGTNVVDNITFNGSFTAPKLKSTDYGTANITITGLAASATQYTVSGIYSRIGSFTTLGGQNYYGTSHVVLTTTNVLFTKPGGLLISGSATAVISGTSNYGHFSYKGTFKFIAGNKATLTLGTIVYNINLVTGYYAQQ